MNNEAIERQLLAIQNQINANLHALERAANREDHWWIYHQLVSIRFQVEAIRLILKEDQEEDQDGEKNV